MSKKTSIPALTRDMTPAEAVRRLRKYWPAHLGYDIHVRGELASYGQCAFWPDGGTFLKYAVAVSLRHWNEDKENWYHSSREVSPDKDEQASIREAVEAMERFIPWVEPEADRTEQPLFESESGVTA